MRDDIDDHIRRLWRHRGTTLPTPRRGPRQQLDLDDILDAAVAIADADGLEAVSTRAVAARFGKTAMALYPYVGTKENLVALMQDHASPLPSPPPATLREWALARYALQVAHPWLSSAGSGGPHERDWLECLLRVLDAARVPDGLRPTAVTMLYATVRANAEAANEYRRIDADGAAEWMARARATQALLPDLASRYPLSTSLVPHAADWRDAPRAALLSGVDLLATALGGPPAGVRAP